MNDWAGLLVDDLEVELPGVSSVIGLGHDMGGEQFEANLGQWLKFAQAIPLVDRFIWFGAAIVGQPWQPIHDWMPMTKQRIEIVTNVLRRNLYASFGDTLDPSLAQKVYGAFLGHLGPGQLMCATTNYDMALEVAFDRLGKKVRDGFRRPDNYHDFTFDPEGLGEWEDDGNNKTVDVLKLHGSVGWYKESDRVYRMSYTARFNPTLGDPVFLPPDPEKEPTSDATVGFLWNAFEKALAGASHALVIGHSLHDAALVRELGKVSKRAKVIVASRHPEALDISKIPGARRETLEFGPNTPLPGWIARWLSHGEDPPSAARKSPRGTK
jgi:hypothetical protein